jgi:hypothetical protein
MTTEPTLTNQQRANRSLRIGLVSWGLGFGWLFLVVVLGDRLSIDGFAYSALFLAALTFGLNITGAYWGITTRRPIRDSAPIDRESYARATLGVAFSVIGVLGSFALVLFAFSAWLSQALR